MPVNFSLPISFKPRSVNCIRTNLDKHRLKTAEGAGKALRAAEINVFVKRSTNVNRYAFSGFN